MKNKILLLIISLWASSSFALTIVTDLDDTIKKTNVRNPAAAVYNAIFSKKAFEPMPELIRQMERYSDEIYILSASPNLINFRIKSFLAKNDIPHDGIFTRRLDQLGAKKQYKLEVIKSLMDGNDEQFIFLGDNAELDEEVYREVKKKHPKRILDIYIHEAYAGEPKSKEVKYFITAFDIAAQEFLAGRMDFNEVKNIAQTIVTARDMEKIIPKFAFCPTKFSAFNRLPIGMLSVLDTAVKTKIVGYCKVRPKAVEIITE